MIIINNKITLAYERNPTTFKNDKLMQTNNTKNMKSNSYCYLFFKTFEKSTKKHHLDINFSIKTN